VTDILPELMTRVDASVVYACGPMPMLAAVAKISTEMRTYSQCAVEEAMACGIGVCMTCVLPVVGEDGVTRMLRSCTDGPVFRGDRVRWSDVGSIPSDALGAPVEAAH
jgi:dihydroorotate dehydrogenase electron transfer subunit